MIAHWRSSLGPIYGFVLCTIEFLFNVERADSDPTGTCMQVELSRTAENSIGAR